MKKRSKEGTGTVGVVGTRIRQRQRPTSQVDPLLAPLSEPREGASARGLALLHGKSQQKIEVMDRTQRLADLIERQQLTDLTLR
jgi:hypothetical protein